ncbi:MAG: HlyD family efflux transporter periplasmic adaptor subunit [Hyphomicrobium sp.]
MTRTAKDASPAGDHPRLDIRTPVLGGLIAILLFFGFGVGGAAVAPIDKGVGLPGTIIVESKVKQVAHPRGGVAGQIHVNEGQAVKSGDLLVTLDSAAVDEQIASLKIQVAAAERQLMLARQEAATISDLQTRQLAAKSKVLALDRLVAEVEKDISSIGARLAMAERERTQMEIRAPVGGRVMSLQTHATGAVVQPGAVIAEIVPDGDRLVVEGRLSPNQIENVKPGMPAKVWLTALSWREQRPLAATLAWVSADSVEDKRTGIPYFVARIELSGPLDDIRRGAALHPGMRAEVLLLTGQRTLLDQLVDPLMRNINRAFHG